MTEDFEWLFRQLMELDRVVHATPPRSLVRWSWVISPDAVELMRRHFDLRGQQPDADWGPDAQMQIFGLPVRLDETATEPMLELRLDGSWTREKGNACSPVRP